MVRGLNGRHPWLVACAALFALALTTPARAQSTGMVRGVVKDATGKPVEGAKISIDADANNRHFETKSDKKGEFVQIGLPPGAYKVSAEKDKDKAAPVPINVRIANASPVTLVLGAPGAGGMSPEAAAKNAELKKTFEEGVAARGGGNADAMFNQGVILWNAGKIAEAKKQFEGAVAAKPDHAEAHYQLGMALVNEGNLAGAATEFETYIKLAPSGPNAATAKGILG